MNKTYYSWECPPRKLVEGKWLDFAVDLKRVCKGEKIDKFTELPKFIEFANVEKKFLRSFKGTFIKLVADSNAYYLSPETLNNVSKEKLNQIFCQFRELIQEECDERYGPKVKVILFTEFMKNSKEEYEKIFFDVLNSVEKYLPNNEIKGIKQYLIDHVGYKPGKELDDFTKRVIASYIAEGVVIPKILRNPVWVNYDEPPVLAEVTNKLNNGVEIVYTEEESP